MKEKSPVNGEYLEVKGVDLLPMEKLVDVLKETKIESQHVLMGSIYKDELYERTLVLETVSFISPML